LEYHADLGIYYANGFGHANPTLHANIVCAVVQDLFNHFDNPAGPNARILMTLPSFLQIVLSNLFAFDDDVSITRHNIGQQAHRLWRSSWISPKAGHMVIVKYDCVGDDDDLLFLFNERPLIIPGCQPNGLCKLQFIRERYSRFNNVNCAEVFCSSN